MGGRLPSERVAGFRRNRWPDCVGISGRIGSDYAGLPTASQSLVVQPVRRPFQLNVELDFKTTWTKERLIAFMIGIIMSALSCFGLLPLCSLRRSKAGRDLAQRRRLGR